MRDDDPDEADQAGDGDRCRGTERRSDDEREPHPPHVDPEARRLVVPEAEHVDDATQRDDHDESDRDVRQDQDDVRPARARDVPEDPRVDLLQRLRVLLLDERLPGGEERRDRHAREDERRGVPLPASPSARRRTSASTAIAPPTNAAIGSTRCPRRPVGQVRDRDRRAEARHLRRRRGGTGPRAGSGTRPGTSRRRRRASRRRAPRARRAARGSATGSPPRSARATSTTPGKVQPRGGRLEDRRRPRGRPARRGRRRPARRAGTRPPRTPTPGSARAPGPPERAPRRRRHRRYWRSRASADAIARKKSTSRGPQRDAIESSTRTIDPSERR